MTEFINLEQLIAALAGETAAKHGLRVLDQSLTHLYAVVPQGTRLEVLDVERHLPTPTRKRAARVITAPLSYAAYITRHAERGTELWVDPSAGRCIAVIDGHYEHGEDNFAGWGDHTATLQLVHTGAWKRLTAGVGTMLTQAAFSMWLEENADLLVAPEAGELLELVDTLHVTSSGKSSQVRRVGHGTHIAWDEETRIAAGKAGTELPSRLTAEVEIFEGLDVVARFDLRLMVKAKVGEPVGFKLDAPRLEDAVRTHCRRAVDLVIANAPSFVPVFEGTPR